MFPPFDEEKAFAFCKEIVSLLDEKKLSLETAGMPSGERAENGIMLGVLVARTSAGEEKVLYTVSGTARTVRGTYGKAVFVEPIVSSAQIADALRKNDLAIHRLTEQINAAGRSHSSVQALSACRSALTSESLKKVFSLYSFHCFDGTVRTLEEMCRARNRGNLPPSGTGDCCAPKLLDCAFKDGLVPVSLCEVFYGKSADSRSSGTACSPCDERCGIILPEMLGLKILYRDSEIIVVDKQSGILSVPGRGAEKQDCIASRVRRLFPQCIAQPAVHRLDMETSGIQVLAFTKEAHRNLCRQFEEGRVQKKYIALLDGVLAKKGIAPSGTMELYFRLDVENRPRQIWDPVNGKKAVTEWNILNVEKHTMPDGSRRDVTRVQFIPHTGRTHQLRLASADSHGFSVPIAGDSLYGNGGGRLLLHARYICFAHPATGRLMEFTCEPEF